MRSQTLTRWFLGALVCGSMNQLWAQPNEPIRIRGIHYGGTGCPASTVDTYVSPDAQAMTLIFDQYLVEAGANIPASSSRKFCNLLLDLVVPSGWQFSVFKVDYRGFVDLRAATNGAMSSTYSFSGSDGRLNSRTTSAKFYGPVAGNYTKSDDIGLDTLVWSPCSVERGLNIKTEARVSGRSGLLTVDTIDGEFKQIYHFKWRRCGR